MLDLIVLYQATKNVLTKGTKNGIAWSIATLVLYIAIFRIAINRAMICSSQQHSTPDSRLVHFNTGLASPVLYLLTTNIVPGICPPMIKINEFISK